MNAKWRRFEQLISRIEQALAPSGAVVVSPDRILDKVTGELREVDASIHYKIGTSPILITIECRDRTGAEDVRWIEQLAEKQRSIGASITVAVSSSRFTEPALKKAAALGIQVRVLTDAGADDFIRWLKIQNLELDVSEWALAELVLELYDAPNDTGLLSSVQKSFREHGPLAPIFIRNMDGKRFHVENILIEWTKRNGTFFPEDLPIDGTKIRRNLHQPLDRGLLHIETTKGDYDIRVIHIGLLISRSKSRVPIERFYEYADSTHVLVQTAESNPLQNMKLSFHRDVMSGETKVSLTSDEE
jgi:hypothetical protein